MRGRVLLELGDVAQQVLLLARQLLHARPLARVERRVHDLGLARVRRRTAAGVRDDGRVDGEAVDGEVGRREVEGFGDVLESRGERFCRISQGRFFLFFSSLFWYSSVFSWQLSGRTDIRQKKTHLVDERLDLCPELVLFLPLHRREGLVEVRGGGASHVGDQVREVVGRLELDLALVRRIARVHGDLGLGASDRGEKTKGRMQGGARGLFG